MDKLKQYVDNLTSEQLKNLYNYFLNITITDAKVPVKLLLLFKDLGISGYEHAQSVEILRDLVFAKQNNNQ